MNFVQIIEESITEISVKEKIKEHEVSWHKIALDLALKLEQLYLKKREANI